MKYALTCYAQVRNNRARPLSPLLPISSCIQVSKPNLRGPALADRPWLEDNDKIVRKLPHLQALGGEL